MSMQCWSCKKYLNDIFCGCFNNPAVTCKECYVKARDVAVELERENKDLGREIEELKANVGFLRHPPPSSHGDPVQDVKLVASDDSPDDAVPANKFVLASRSPVFKAMLETKMEESISGTVQISDVNHDLLRAFVNYLYTADVCLDEKIASGLLVLAEKYQVKHLKEHCERYLVSSLNWDNSILNYVFAYKHSAVKLLEASLLIIINDIGKFINRDEYRELVKEDPSFVVEILEAHIKNRDVVVGVTSKGVDRLLLLVQACRCGLSLLVGCSRFESIFVTLH